MKHRILLKIFIFLSVVGSFVSITFGEDLYKWMDENGIPHFSDTPPPSQFHKSPEKQLSNIGIKPPHFPAKGLFWKIETDGNMPHSYLLGTIHSDDKRILDLKPEIWKSFNEAGQFIMEMKLDHTIFLKMQEAMVFSDGSDLKSLLDKETYPKIISILASFGFTEPMVRPMKPWAVMSILSSPRPQNGQFLDLYLYTKALDQKKTVYGLETPEEQLAVIDSMPMKDQVELLIMTLNQQETIPEIFEEMISTYLMNDLDAIYKLVSKYNFGEKKEVYQRFMLRLNDKRNIKMADRLIPYLRKGNSFIAVGALHLGGKTGLIKLLSDKGYHLSSIP